MPYEDYVKFRDNRTGRWRRAAPYEKNRHFKIDTLSRGLANFMFKTMDGMGEHAQEFAADLVEYARRTAPWADRTGAAREGLTSEVTLADGSLEIALSHTAEYGIWLEIRWGGRYAVIIPTIETMGPRLYQRMNGMLGDIIYYD